jgi:hypothetical protein
MVDIPLTTTPSPSPPQIDCNHRPTLPVPLPSAEGCGPVCFYSTDGFDKELASVTCLQFNFSFSALVKLEKLVLFYSINTHVCLVFVVYGVDILSFIPKKNRGN